MRLMALELGVVGLINAQFAIQADLESEPSRRGISQMIYSLDPR